MSRWLDDPEGAADNLLASLIADGGLGGAGERVLAAYQYRDGKALIEGRGASVVVWNRHMRSGRAAQASPPQGSFDTGVLRLPKSRLEQAMALHQMLSALRPGAGVFAYGGNDEGIRSFQKVFAAVVDDAETVVARGHGRALRGIYDGRAVRGGLADWQERSTLSFAATTVDWISYPGLFAGGALDDGTALLLSTMPPLADDARVLDFGSGPGAISRLLWERVGSLSLTLVDNDSVALVAAAENLPRARLVLADSLGAVRGQVDDVFDAIVSNPPLHSGVREDHAALVAMIEGAPKMLAATGTLTMVVQRRVACAPFLETAFERVSILADDGRFRVWRAEAPRRGDASRGAGRKPGRRPAG